MLFVLRVRFHNKYIFDTVFIRVGMWVSVHGVYGQAASLFYRTSLGRMWRDNTFCRVCLSVSVLFGL